MLGTLLFCLTLDFSVRIGASRNPFGNFGL